VSAGPYINYRAEAGTINDHDTFFDVTKFHGPAIIGGPNLGSKREDRFSNPFF